METTLIEKIQQKTNSELEKMLKKFSIARVEIFFYQGTRCISIKISCYNTENLHLHFDSYDVLHNSVDIKAVKKTLRSDILSLGKENKYTSKLVWFRNLLAHEPYWIILEKT